MKLHKESKGTILVATIAVAVLGFSSIFSRNLVTLLFLINFMDWFFFQSSQ